MVSFFYQLSKVEADTGCISDFLFGGFSILVSTGLHVGILSQDSFQLLRNKKIYNLHKTFNRITRVDLKSF